MLLLYAEGSYTKMVTLGRSLARAGRAADDSQMQAIGTRVEGGALIRLGRLAEGAALMAAALPADPAAGDERAVQAASLLSVAYLAMGEVDRCAALSERMLAAAERAGDQARHRDAHRIPRRGLLRARRLGPRPRLGRPGPGALRRQFLAHGHALVSGCWPRP